MLNGLDLFSGVGGITLGLSKWVRPIAYCELDKHARSVLLQLQVGGGIPIAPIWGDVTTLRGRSIPFPVDIISGGFPCQDISVAGNGIGLEGKRSGLFFEIARLVSELRPRFIFLENVPAITVRGLDRVLLELTALGYDCRWTIVSAGELGAPHLRERWWLLAHANGKPIRQQSIVGIREGTTFSAINGSPAGSESISIELQQAEERNRKPRPNRTSGEMDSNAEIVGWKQGRAELRLRRRFSAATSTGREVFTNASSQGLQRWLDAKEAWSAFALGGGGGGGSWPSWLPQPAICGGPNGVPGRVDELTELGNAVCPQAVEKAFARLLFGGAA